MINFDDYFGGLSEEEYIKETNKHFKWMEENSKPTVLMAENVEINKEEFIKQLQQSQAQIIPSEKHYEIRYCPFSSFDEYCTGYCVNCDDRSEYVDIIKNKVSRAIKEYIEKVSIKLADNARSDYWHWIDDILHEVEREMVGE